MVEVYLVKHDGEYVMVHDNNYCFFYSGDHSWQVSITFIEIQFLLRL